MGEFHFLTISPSLIGADGRFHGRTPVEVFLYERVLITLPVPWLCFSTCIFGINHFHPLILEGGNVAKILYTSLKERAFIGKQGRVTVCEKITGAGPTRTPLCEFWGLCLVL